MEVGQQQQSDLNHVPVTIQTAPVTAMGAPEPPIGEGEGLGGTTGTGTRSSQTCTVPICTVYNFRDSQSLQVTTIVSDLYSFNTDPDPKNFCTP